MYQMRNVKLMHKYLDEQVVCDLTIAAGGEGQPACTSRVQCMTEILAKPPRC